MDTQPKRPIAHGDNEQRSPIAIVGIGCRFPGNVNNPEQFWHLLANGIDAIEEVPASRWDLRRYFDPDPGSPGTTYTHTGGFLRGIDEFDAQFFGISPREALHSDPQQRLLLELAYEALEDAGFDPAGIAGSKTGVFVGISTYDYASMQSGIGQRYDIGAYTNLGLAQSIAANRLSYFFDFTGPSLVVDTACSSSLVAAHLACQSIWSGESKLALVGGVNAVLRPEGTVGFSRASMLAPDGRCKSFDANADGYGRSEGAAVVVLKPLAQALADGDSVYALIRGTHVNQDGRTPGVSVPSLQSQQRMLEEVYASCGVLPEHVQYIEAHGTGTPVGDPIEATALGNVLGKGRPAGDFCVIGSAKTNLGHMEAASGMAGLIKAALSLKHRLIPPNLHFKTPNPNIAFDDLRLRVPTTLEPWPDTQGRTAFAGANSFGFGGTNAHVVLEEAPPSAHEERSATGVDAKAFLLPISARDPAALRDLASAYVDFLATEASEEQPAFADIAYSAALRRGHLHHRLAVVASTAEQAGAAFQNILDSTEDMEPSLERSFEDSKLAFVFSGMGTQWWAMGRQLLETEPVFRAAVEECDRLLRRFVDWSLVDALTASEAESRIDETVVAQAAIFATQVGLAALWRSWGIEPDAVIGHSVGEVAAAYVSGALTLEDAITVVHHRSRLQQRTAGSGKMLAVGLSGQDAQALLASQGHLVSVAAVNSRNATTLAGDAEALAGIAEQLDERGVFNRFLEVDVPYHSPNMDPLRDELLASLSAIRSQQPQVPLYSTAVGGRIAEGELDAEYWWQNMRSAVKFAGSVGEMLRDGHNIFLEISSHPALASSLRECLADNGGRGTVLASLRRNSIDRDELLRSLAFLYELHRPINWNGLFPDGGKHVRLPQYRWQHERYWREAPDSAAERIGRDEHPLLGRRSDAATATWTLNVEANALSYLTDHCVRGQAVFPAAGVVEMALAAARLSLGGSAWWLESVSLLRLLSISDGGLQELQFVFNPDDGYFAIHSRNPAKDSVSGWQVHSKGRAGSLGGRAAPRFVALSDVHGRCEREISAEFCYGDLRHHGLEYGPAFQGIQRIWAGHMEALAEVRLPGGLDGPESYLLHPALLDACFQSLVGASPGGLGGATSDELLLPVSIERVSCYAPAGGEVLAHIQVLESSASVLKGNIEILDLGGRVLASINGFTCRRMATGPQGNAVDAYEYQWVVPASSAHDICTSRPALLPSPLDIADGTRARVEELSGQGNIERHTAFDSDVHDLTISYVLNAFLELGLQTLDGQVFSVEIAKQKLGVIDQHQSLLKSLLELLAEDGILRKQAEDYTFTGTLERRDSAKQWRDTLSAFPAYQAEAMLVKAPGERLGEALTGAVDGLDLLFPDGSSSTLEHLYQDSPTFRFANLVASGTVHRLVQDRRDKGRLRLLEIGAGTGGLTSYILPVLGNDCDYVFTDVGQTLLNQAEQKFADHSFVRYQLLDLESDLTEQNYEPGSFDVILASDVLHATSDLHTTLARVKQLLAPGGVLVLLELTKRWEPAAITFGLLKGWWAFSDDDLRVEGPWLSRDAWETLLGEAGFEDAQSFEDGLDGIHDVFVCRQPASQDAASSPPDASNDDAEPRIRDRWLVFKDKSGAGDFLHSRLIEDGQTAVTVEVGAEFCRLSDTRYTIRPSVPDDYVRLMDEAGGGWRGIVHLWSCDLPPSPSTAGELEESQQVGPISVLHLAQVFDKLGLDRWPDLYVVTRGAQADLPDPSAVSQAPVWGFVRSLMNEEGRMRTRLVDVAEVTTADDLALLYEELWQEDDEDEIALRDGTRLVHRLTRVHLNEDGRESDLVPLPETPVRLEIAIPGILSSLSFTALEHPQPKDGEVVIEVYAAALNFKDVMVAMRRLPEEALEASYAGTRLGLECSGRIVAVGRGVSGLSIGDEVLAPGAGTLATHVAVDARFVFPKPRDISFEEAATIPVAFLTAYYALHRLADLRKGERVLIHAGSGGVGLAAIQLAQAAGAEIFATAGSDAKRDFLRAIGVPHVFDSRSVLFGDEILEVTNGEGVDVILNSLAGEAIAKGLSILRAGGRFVEIGKSDIYSDTRIGLRPFRKGLSLFAVDFDQLWLERPDLVQTLLAELKVLLDAGTVRPLTYRVFSMFNAPSAFRYLAQARQIGKVVISMRDRGFASLRRPALEPAPIRQDATYLITGGLGGLGLATAEWLVENGARHLVLVGRSGASSPVAQATVEKLRDKSINVRVVQGDVSREDDVRSVLDEIRVSGPPLGGIIHAAMVLDDGLVIQSDAASALAPFRPKASGAWNLHHLTQDTKLDFFVMYSSCASILGSPSQANYSAANAFLDALAHLRVSQGLPALAVNWGAIADVGYVAERPEVAQRLGEVGWASVPLEKTLKALSQAMAGHRPQVGIAAIDWRRLAENGLFRDSPRIAHLSEESGSDNESSGPSIRSRLALAPPEEHAKMMQLHIREQLARVLQIDAPRINVFEPLLNLGLDSLMALEMRNRVRNEFGVDVPFAHIVEGLSTAGLAALILEDLGLASPLTSPADEHSPQAPELESAVQGS